MIADTVSLSIMTIDFCHAAGRLALHRGFAAVMSAVRMMRWERRGLELTISAVSRKI